MFKWIGKGKREKERIERIDRECKERKEIKNKEADYIKENKDITLQELVNKNPMCFNEGRSVQDHFYKQLGLLCYRSEDNELCCARATSDCLMILDKRIKELEQKLETIETIELEQTERE